MRDSEAAESVVLARNLKRLEGGIEREGTALLARWKLPECAEEFPHVLLSRHEQEDVFDPPAVPVHGLHVADLERIGSDIEYLRRAQRREGLAPDRCTCLLYTSRCV